MGKRDELPQETEDAIVNLLATRFVEKGVYGEIIGNAPDSERELIEASLERHAARQRAKGLPGW